MNGPLYELQDVVKAYEGRTVLSLERLVLQPGGVTALEGHNGAGKSTLLAMLALLARPDSGRIIYRGRRVDQTEVTTLRREITLVAQDSYLFNTSVEKNVAYGLALRGQPRRQRLERAARALEDVGLAAFAGHRARTLSRGESQRVALARALVLQPLVLLLDEPFANLDPASAEVFEEVIRRQPAQGTAVILVSHDAGQARRLADRVLRLEGGRLAADERLTLPGAC